MAISHSISQHVKCRVPPSGFPLGLPVQALEMKSIAQGKSNEPHVNECSLCHFHFFRKGGNAFTWKALPLTKLASHRLTDLSGIALPAPGISMFGL